MSESRKPIPRPAARVLLLDPANRVLLFRTRDELKQFWITPGGGLDAGETHESAALRELWEETGLTADPEALTCVWTRSHAFEFQGRLIDQQERFFLLSCIESPAIVYENWEAEERTYLLDHRWWTLEEIESSGEIFAPRRLGWLLGQLLANGLPIAPIDVGV